MKDVGQIRARESSAMKSSASSRSLVQAAGTLLRHVENFAVVTMAVEEIFAPGYAVPDLERIAAHVLVDVMDFIKSAKEEGAQLLTGGGKPADPSHSDGLFIAPTVFDNVTPNMRIGCEEIFGPVMSVMPWHDYEDMLAKVNGVEYGLTAAIITGDIAAAMETAERVEAGYVWINSSGRYIGAPYGGWKQSGIGEEECFDEILSYTQVKNINMRW